MKDLQTTTVEVQELSEDWFEYAIFWNRLLLSPLGVWPLDKLASRSERIARMIRLSFSIYLIIIYIIPQCAYVSTATNMERSLEVVAPNIFIFLALVKFVMLMWNDEKIGYCIACLKNDWANAKLQEDRKIMIENAKFGRFMTIGCFGGMYWGVIIYTTILPFFKPAAEIVIGNVSHTERLLPYPIDYVFFNKQSSPIYEITWIIQFAGTSYMCFLNCGGYALIGVLVTHVCCQLKIIVLRLEDLADGNRGEFHTFAQRLAAIVEHHTYVIRYVEFVNKSFQVILLMDEIGALVMICFQGYLILWHWNQADATLNIAVDIAIGTSIIFNLFIVSFVGQRLVDESQQVGIATTRAQWYRLPPTIARSLVMCMVCSTRPLQLSACSMIGIFLTTFGEILKSSYVFLNMVQKVTDI